MRRVSVASPWGGRGAFVVLGSLPGSTWGADFARGGCRFCTGVGAISARGGCNICTLVSVMSSSYADGPCDPSGRLVCSHMISPSPLSLCKWVLTLRTDISHSTASVSTLGKHRPVSRLRWSDKARRTSFAPGDPVICRIAHAVASKLIGPRSILRSARAAGGAPTRAIRTGHTPGCGHGKPRV